MQSWINLPFIIKHPSPWKKSLEALWTFISLGFIVGCCLPGSGAISDFCFSWLGRQWPQGWVDMVMLWLFSLPDFIAKFLNCGHYSEKELGLWLKRTPPNSALSWDLFSLPSAQLNRINFLCTEFKSGVTPGFIGVDLGTKLCLLRKKQRKNLRMKGWNCSPRLPNAEVWLRSSHCQSFVIL